MLGKTSYSYEFGEWQVDPQNRLLMRQGRSVPITPKAFDMLIVLIKNSGQLVGKAELLQALWGDTSVAANILSVNLSTLRKALGEDGNRYILTTAGRGYRFVGEVKEVWSTGAAGSEGTPVATP